MNTEFHYAFLLVDILKTISERTFIFDAPPIAGRAQPHTLDLLQEATRCYLFGLHRACLAACRTALEDSLTQRVPRVALLQEALKSKGVAPSGNLELLIDTAVHIKALRADPRDKAHQIRLKANAVLHQPSAQIEDPWDVLIRGTFCWTPARLWRNCIPDRGNGDRVRSRG